MRISLKKIVALSLLTLSSLSVNATIITGDLSYDDTGSHIITGSNGSSYLGWGEIASYNYAQTLAATQTGGLYESYHIANQNEAGEFFSLATGMTAPTGNNYLSSATNSGQAAFGNNYYNYSSSYAWFLADINDGGAKVGFIKQANSYTIIENNWRSISRSDYYSSTGSYYSKNITWLLVANDSVTVPEPATALLLGLGLLGFGFSRKQKRAS